MAIPVIGTVYQSGKLAALDQKWQQKKTDISKGNKQEMDPQIKQFYEDLKRMKESSRLSEISAKLKAGEVATPEELEYLKRNNPQMYQEAMEVVKEREAYERQLRECKTKEEVEKLRFSKMGSFMAEAKSVMNNPNIPEGEKTKLMEKLLKRTNNVVQTHMNFVASAAYKQLPDDKEKDKAVIPPTDKGFLPENDQAFPGSSKPLEEEVPLVPDESGDEAPPSDDLAVSGKDKLDRQRGMSSFQRDI